MAATEAAAALDVADQTASKPDWAEADRAAKVERRAKIAEVAERRKAAKQDRRELIKEVAAKLRAGREQLRSITDQELDEWARGFDEYAKSGKPRTSKLSRDPARRADIANTRLTPSCPATSSIALPSCSESA